LLAVGVVLLLEREWWDRSRQRVMDWWARRALVTTTSADVHVLALLSTLAPAVLAIVLPLSSDRNEAAQFNRQPPPPAASANASHPEDGRPTESTRVSWVPRRLS
jgi:hypothetical protein